MGALPQELPALPSPPARPEPPQGRPGPALWLRALRPRQWTKNAAVLAPLVFAQSALEPGPASQAALAVAAFCLLAGAVYVFNDWMDRDRDRLHPEKRHLPIASGALGSRGALALGACSLLAGLALCVAVGPAFVGVALGYLALQLLYSFWLKHLVLLDVMAIASGFVIRVVAGGVAIGVPVSNWLYLCTLLLSVFLALAKRRHELSATQDAAGHRSNLSEYSQPLLDQMMSMVGAACILAYGLYTVSAETVAKVGSDRLKYTVPLVLYGVLRYLFLVHRRNLGGAPERVLLSDGPMRVLMGLYTGLIGWALYL